tara:strand:- start:212 stop:499 length:288 start_codon:yes stop_codon:yes gene_type:complete
MSIYREIFNSKKNNSKLFALLVDPDKQDNNDLLSLVEKSIKAKVDLFFIGGSLLMDDKLEECITTIKSKSDIPVIHFQETLCKSAIRLTQYFFSH